MSGSKRNSNIADLGKLEKGYGDLAGTHFDTTSTEESSPGQLDGQRDSTNQRPRLSLDPSQTGQPKRKLTIPTETPTSKKRSVFQAPLVQDIDPAADRLDDDSTPLDDHAFCTLMGIKPAAMLRPGQDSQMDTKTRAIPHGLLSRIHNSYQYTNTKYRAFDILVYALLVLQLILAALFVVLGSVPNLPSRTPIAVLGAISTVIAGGLAIVKGQGLPNRLRKQRDGLGNVLFEANELCWDHGAGKPLLYRDVRRLREDYLRVLEEGRRNHPDNWNSTTVDIAAGKGKGAKLLK